MNFLLNIKRKKILDCNVISHKMIRNKIDTRDLRTRIETIQITNEILAYFVESYKAYVTTIEYYV